MDKKHDAIAFAASLIFKALIVAAKYIAVPFMNFSKSLCGAFYDSIVVR